MRGTLAVLGGLLLLADAGPVRAQFLYGPAGYGGWGHRGGIGFAFTGNRFAVRGFIGGYGYSPWGCYGGPVSVVAPVGYWVAPPPVVVVNYATVPRYGLFGPDDRPRPGTFDPPPAPDPFARQRVNAAVKRGDLLVFRPNGNGLQKPPVKVPAEPPARVPKDPGPRWKVAFAAGEYGRATELLTDAVAAKPEEALLYFHLAQARAARGQYAEAVAAIRDGLRRDPNWPTRPFDLKAAYGPNAAAFDEHLAELKQAAAANPNDPTLGFLLGYHLWFLGEKAEAVRLFKRAARQVKDRGMIERFLRMAEGK